MLMSSGSDVAATAGAGADDRLRAQHYSLLSVLLGRAPTRDVLDLVADVRGDASPLGLAYIALADAAAVADPDAVQHEYFRLFIGIGRGELVPYGSFYLTGFLQERPLARLRGDLAALGIERSPDLHEPEDHIAVVCEVMAALADGRLGTEPGADRPFFDRHLKPWAARFFADLEVADNAPFYRHVGAVGRTFMDIETEVASWAA